MKTKTKKDDKETLYARIEKVNKVFIENLAHKERLSEAYVVNKIITDYRASAKARKSRTSSEASL